MNDKSNYILIGSFPIHDAKLICDSFESKSIDFKLEMNDSAIRGMEPFQAALGGTYGSGALVNLYVAPDLLEQCEKLIADITEQ